MRFAIIARHPDDAKLEALTEYSRFLIALLVILDPFAAVAVFTVLARDLDPTQQRRAATMVTVTVLGALLLFAVSGTELLNLLGTGVDSFRVGGGLVLLLMGFEMLRGVALATDSAAGAFEDARPAGKSPATVVVPLAIPFLAGPGAISTVMLEMHRGAGPIHLALVLGIITLVCAVLWVALRLATPIAERLGHVGLAILNRLFGLIVVVIAVEVMARGLRGLFPLLGD